MSAALARAMVDDACRHPIYELNPLHESCFYVLAKCQPVLDSYIGDRDDFGADYVGEVMLPVGRVHLKWEGTPPCLIHRYTTASTLKAYFLQLTSRESQRVSSSVGGVM